MKKKITVIIPVFNNISIAMAIESVKVIKTDEVGLIVIDGGSTDGTIEIISKYKEIIDIFISEKDDGIYDAMNKGILLADSEWVFILASDDKLICNPIEIIKRYEDGQYDLLCGNIIRDYNNGTYLIGKSDKDLSQLKTICSLWQPATFFKKSVFEQYGQFNKDLKCAGDRDLFLRLYEQGAKFYIMDEFVTLFREGGISTKNPVKCGYLEDMILSDRYGANKVKTRLFFIKRSFRFWGSKLKDLLGIKHQSRRLTKTELYKELENEWGQAESLRAYFG
ncbi:glycosyltransferase family 2 protein [Lachnospiraceae bacterium 62-35]